MASHDFTLKGHPTIPKPDGPVLVCILDGWGENEYKDDFNAVHTAETPTTDALKTVPSRWRTVRAHGTAVGLPTDDDMGNSEVGHNALGSGQVVDQGARLVDKALSTGAMFTGAGWKYISQSFAAHTVHFIGLMSDGGVHSRLNQLTGCIKGAVETGAKRIRLHVLADGRDVPDGSSIKFLEQLLEECKPWQAKCDIKVGSGGGRMGVTMDRYEVGGWASECCPAPHPTPHYPTTYALNHTPYHHTSPTPHHTPQPYSAMPAGHEAIADRSCGCVPPLRLTGTSSRRAGTLTSLARRPTSSPTQWLPSRLSG